MKVLVIGKGGREHTLVWKISQSRRVEKIYCAPGNAGIAELAECVPIKDSEINELADFAEKNNIDLTVVGPETALVEGIVDVFEARDLKIFGPSKKAALLEGSKIFAKEVMKSAKIFTASYKEFDNSIQAMIYAKTQKKCVIKADGLAAGKGVFVCKNKKDAANAVKQIMIEKKFGDSGKKIIVEEMLEGEEASILAFSDGKTVKLMVSSQDHKRALDNDEGLNTGGMGAYSPAPIVTKEIEQRVLDEIIQPTINEMSARGIPYKGVLYAGLMIDNNKINVLEFNVRFGDPETQVVLSRLKSDLVGIMLSCIEGTLDNQQVFWEEAAATCVVLASGGYPLAYEKGFPILGLKEAVLEENSVIFHAGTRKLGNHILTDGGRVLGVVGFGKTIKNSIDQAYKTVSLINFKNMHYRSDIGKKALKRLECRKKN